MPTPFSEHFSRLRREAGYPTAYAFFQANGGQKVFQCSFRNYIRIEQGTSLPKPERLPRLCAMLRLPLKSEELRGLVRSYLVTMLGETSDWMLAPLEASIPPAAPPQPAERALQKLVRDDMRPISVAQFEAIMDSAESYACYRVLTATKESYGAEELSALLKLSEARVQEALLKLHAQGIVERLKDKRFRSPLVGASLLFPDPKTLPEELMARVYRYNKTLMRQGGEVLDTRYWGARVDLNRLQGYFAHFRETIRSLQAYSTSERSDSSALVFVEGRISKLFDF
jgi:hypothetical protein